MRYAWKPEAMQKYVERRGEQFRRDLFDPTVKQRAFKEPYGVDQSVISQLRRNLVPGNLRKTNRHKVTPEMIAAFKTKATTAKLAKRFNIPYGTMERMRRRHVGIRINLQIRLSDSVMALLRSSFSTRRVATALKIHQSTVWMLRVKLGIHTPKTKIVLTDEQRAILIESKSRAEASRRLGIPVSRMKRWYFLVQEGIL